MGKVVHTVQVPVRVLLRDAHRGMFIYDEWEGSRNGEMPRFLCVVVALGQIHPPRFQRIGKFRQERKLCRRI